MADQRNDEGLWDHKECAAFLKISPKTCKRWGVERKLPVVKIGNKNLYDPAAIRAWVAKRARPAKEAS